MGIEINGGGKNTPKRCIRKKALSTERTSQVYLLLLAYGRRVESPQPLSVCPKRKEVGYFWRLEKVFPIPKNAFSKEDNGALSPVPDKNPPVKRRMARASSGSLMIRAPYWGCHPQFKQRVSIFSDKSIDWHTTQP
jgi:hypothetical protein